MESVKEQIKRTCTEKEKTTESYWRDKEILWRLFTTACAALAAHAITTTDWNAMIASVEKLISSL
ncbi:MAG: hypothetical protein ACLSB9_30580 [Hydrogeniiclostridium mannosilyticum]